MKRLRTLLVISTLLIMALSAMASGSDKSDTSKCTICGKPATHQFQGSGYCDSDYQDAVKWAMDHSGT